jgi:tetratricopeptide (TPR) repeat protein
MPAASRFRACAIALAAVAASAIAGCAGAPRFDETPRRSIELDDVPFYPQTAFQCGPASLATVLAYEGLAITPNELAPAVYVEGLRGSLQAELLAATRRHGLIPYPLEPDARALFAEIESGKPVLVLQNLGIDRFPVWHYAVVVGFDAERDRVVLRSGKHRRRQERLGQFLKSWERGGNWAFVAAPAAEPPATATADGWIRAITDARHVLPPDAVEAAFAAARARWPADPLVLFAAAVHEGSNGRPDFAARDYRALLEIQPEHAAARNNLAHLLADDGCISDALREARRALETLGGDSPLRPAIEDTVVTLTGLLNANGQEPEHCAAPGGSG